MVTTFGFATASTLGVTFLAADLLQRTDWWNVVGWSTLSLFAILTWPTMFGLAQALVGFVVRRARGETRSRIRRGALRAPPDPRPRTALVFPIHNENVTRTFEGLRTVHRSLARCRALEGFAFFILSDSTDTRTMLEETRAWRQLVAELGGRGRIHYRHRVKNTGRKTGNVEDFLADVGDTFRYFVILDADSVMAGSTLVALVETMEARPRTALLQTAPALFGGTTLFGRMQQFANRLYTPVFAAGLAAWAQGTANYYGHNAIVRTRAFLDHCGLPLLPGRYPFGGPVLSHDFVEAALLVKEGWDVDFHELEGSWEEGPQSVVASAVRDRRWCQGNLQHLVVQCAHGLRWQSRLHMLLGTLSYLSAPLWLAFVVLADAMVALSARGSGGGNIALASKTGLDWSVPTQAFVIFCLSMSVFAAPRLLSLVDLALDPVRKRRFGGLFRCSLGVTVEAVLSTLFAPILMLWYSHFVVSMIRGHAVSWAGQDRGATGTTWREAARRHGVHTLVGATWATLHAIFLPATLPWLLPLILGLCLSIPLSVLTSRVRPGSVTRRLGLLLTPEETEPPRELAELDSRIALLTRAARSRKVVSPEEAFAERVLDPCLLRTGAGHDVWPASAVAKRDPEIAEVSERLLRGGPGACTPAERQRLLADQQELVWVHRQAWLRSHTNLDILWLSVRTRLVRSALVRA